MRHGLIVGLFRDGTGGDALVSPAPMSEIKAIFSEVVATADPAKYGAVELWTRDGLAKRKRLKSATSKATEAEQPEQDEETDEAIETEQEPDAPKRRGRTPKSL
jgi:hypothetical protein